MSELFIKIERKKSSYEYQFNPNINTFQNNKNHNCQDKLILLKDGIEIYRYEKLQTVPNHPDNNFFNKKDAIIGKFQLKCFVEAVKGGSFADPYNPGRIILHKVINSQTVIGSKLNSDGMIVDNYSPKGRGCVWFHSSYYPPMNKETINCYSEACIMFQKVSEIDGFGQVLKDNGIKVSDILNGEIIEIDG
jgi:hypothetical protein